MAKKLNEAKGYLKLHGKMDYDPMFEEELEKGWFQEREVVVDATGKILSDLED